MIFTVRNYEGKIVETMSDQEAVNRGYLSETIETQQSLSDAQ